MRAMFTRARGERGISLIEAMIVLLMTSILAAVAAPSISRTVAQSRLARAQNDAQAIKTAINNFLTEFTAFSPAAFTSDGTDSGDTIAMLVSDGDIPPLHPDIAALGAPDDNWSSYVQCCGGVNVAFLEGHLVTNTNLGAGGAYDTNAGGWRGAYISAPVDPDPWGNRYMVNVEYLRGASTSNDVFVLSAGPDEQVDTQFEFESGGAVPGDDDIISIIRRDSGATVP